MEAPLRHSDYSHESQPSTLTRPPDPPAPEEGADNLAHSIHSVTSRTSTLEFHHEPFEDLKPLVEQLCSTLWPSPARKSTVERILGNRFVSLIRRKTFSLTAYHALSNTFHVERLLGGSFNRIIGITVTEPKLQDANRYILRMPRFESARPDREVAVIEYVHRYSTIPVAKIIATDFTKNNPLKHPYVVQNRIPGFDSQSKK